MVRRKTETNSRRKMKIKSEQCMVRTMWFQNMYFFNCRKENEQNASSGLSGVYWKIAFKQFLYFSLNFEQRVSKEIDIDYSFVIMVEIA